ncbi:MAG TPA: nucleotidyltransferase family protein [Candidatus Acidoferrum sp.]
MPQNPSLRLQEVPIKWFIVLECANPNAGVGLIREFLRMQTTNWPALVELADEQGMLPLVTARLGELAERLVPAEIKTQLTEAARAQTLFTLSMTAELFHILDRFHTSNIGVLLTKGPVLSQRCYGDPGLRQFTDLDLIVCHRDIAQAAELMLALGYASKIPLKTIQAKKSPGEYVFTKRGTNLLVEFHTERTFRYHPRPLSVDKLFQQSTRVNFDGQDVPALGIEDELILICIHGAKHFWERLMWIADVAALVSRQQVDWNRAMEIAREVQAERMLRIGLVLAMNVAGASLPAPIASGIRADAAAVKIAEQIRQRLIAVKPTPLSLPRRAAFRVKMRGGLLTGVAYLLRLSLSPTEEDWQAGSERSRSGTFDAIGRPFRLARKYGRHQK